jgi:hypothetical protein
MATAKTATETKTKKDVTEMTQEELKAYYAEPVEIRLMRDNDRYKDDVFVSDGFKSYLIKRGETVVVPRNIAEIIQQSMDAEMESAENLDTLTSEFEDRAKSLNI